jgi:hypothetical protein
LLRWFGVTCYKVDSALALGQGLSDLDIVNIINIISGPPTRRVGTKELYEKAVRYLHTDEEFPAAIQDVRNRGFNVEGRINPREDGSQKHRQ